MGTIDTLGKRTSNEAPIQVLVRAVDAGPTYLAWRWLDDVETPHFSILDPDELTSATEILDKNLIVSTGTEYNHRDPALHALRDGAFARPRTEEELSLLLARTVLPEALLDQIHDRLNAGNSIHLRLTPSPRLARIPWEILPLYPHTTPDPSSPRVRLIEAITITYDPPATVRGSRSRQPHDDPSTTIMMVLDPQLPPRAKLRGLNQTLSENGKSQFSKRIESYADFGYMPNDSRLSIGEKVTRFDVAEQLQQNPSRFFYFGHISSAHDEPGTASLHLSDTCDVWGRTAPFGVPVDDTGAPARMHPGDHRPLSALDLLLGTIGIADAPGSETASTIERFGSEKAGYLIWPMPPRVAMIACEGAADYRSSETFGLVMAAIDAGAALVTTTRWPLPTDSAFHIVDPDTYEQLPTTELALAVDHAHMLDEPVAHLAIWQREQLRLWRESGLVRYTPLLWASLTHTIADSPEADNASG